MHNKQKTVGNLIPSTIFKESIILLIWVGCGTLTLWVADVSGLFSTSSDRQSNSTFHVDFPKVYQIWKREDAVFVDTRSAAEFKYGHIPGAINVPINHIRENLSNLPQDKNVDIVTYCVNNACPNAYQLMNILIANGYQNVRFFPRGLRGWLALGYPLETE